MRVSTKVNTGEENHPAAPVGNQACDLPIMSLALCHWAMPSSSVTGCLCNEWWLQFPQNTRYPASLSFSILYNLTGKREMLNSHPLMVGQWSQRWGHVWCSTPAAAVPRWQGYTWNTQPLTGEATYLTVTVVALTWQGDTWNTQPLTGEVTYLTVTVVALTWQGYTWNTQPLTGEVTYLTVTVVALHWQGDTWNTQPLTGEVTYLTPTVVALHWQGDTWNTQPFTGEVPSNIQPQQPQPHTGKATPKTLSYLESRMMKWQSTPTGAATQWQGYRCNEFSNHAEKQTNLKVYCLYKNLKIHGCIN